MQNQYPFSPFLFLEDEKRRERKPANNNITVPPRVDKALQFLNHLTDKTAIQAIASEHSIEQIPGQNLTEEELNAQATACNMLSKYFAGKLEPDLLESLKIDSIKKKQKPKNANV